VAQLVLNAKGHHTVLRPFPQPADDIFDLLDPGILAAEFPMFPGHTQTQAEWLESKKRVPNRKVFYEQRYGIPRTEDAYARVAGNHAD
jgi:hypothetical protein